MARIVKHDEGYELKCQRCGKKEKLTIYDSQLSKWDFSVVYDRCYCPKCRLIIKEVASIFKEA